MNNVKFSIIIPIYNAEVFLKECIGSLVRQTYDRFEVILINDGSTDNSSKIIDDFASKDKRIKIINQENLGVSAARNAGLDNATGKYIIFIDADDYLRDILALEKMHTTATNHQCDVIMYDIQYEDKNVHYPLNGGEYSDKEGVDSFLFEMIKDEHLNSPCNKVYKRELLNQHRIRFDENIKIGEDLLFNVEYFKHCSSVYYLKESFYFYRTSNINSATSRYLENKYSDLMTVNNKMIEWLKSRSSSKLINVARFIRIKNVLSCIRDLHHPAIALSKGQKMELLKQYKRDNPSLLVWGCGLKIYLASLIYSYININVLGNMIRFIYGAKK